MDKIIYHKDIYNGTWPMKLIDIQPDRALLEGDFSGGTHNVNQRSWVTTNGLMIPNRNWGRFRVVKVETYSHLPKYFVLKKVLWWWVNSPWINGQGFDSEKAAYNYMITLSTKPIKTIVNQQQK